MTIEENKLLVRSYFGDAPYNPAAGDEIFALQVPWHALYRTDQPDFIPDPRAEKTACARHKAL